MVVASTRLGIWVTNIARRPHNGNDIDIMTSEALLLAWRQLDTVTTLLLISGLMKQGVMLKVKQVRVRVSHAHLGLINVPIET